MENIARILAFYLPQFHPIKENNEWWGPGFTEWTNVAKAKKYFRNHYQPRIPADLGFYDLRVEETRIAQATLAAKYGIEGFIYWHYWFGEGRRLLERPFKEVVKSKKPDFPFCLAWANETWKGFAHGLKNRNILIEQKYPGLKDIDDHFYELLPAFEDERYIKVDGKPLFMIYKPLQLPNANLFIDRWNELAVNNGLKGIFFIAQTLFSEQKDSILNLGFDGVNILRFLDHINSKNSNVTRLSSIISRKIFKRPVVHEYKDVVSAFNNQEDMEYNVYPSILPNWDHTPRSGREGLVLNNSTPALFEDHVNKTLKYVQHKPYDSRLIFLKSWNEWAEGNYMEPDLRYGHQYLEALARCNRRVK